MAKSVNKVILLGYTGKDPEVHVLQSGTIVNLSLATNESFKDGRGEWQERVEWHNLVAYQRKAEILRDFVKKGSRIYVEGFLRTRFWDDRASGEKRFRTEIIVVELSLLPSAQGSNRLNGSGQYRAESGVPPYGQYAGPEITRDEVPY